MNRLVALIVLTTAFAPAAVLGALPMVTSIVVVLLVCAILLTSRSTAADTATEPPVTPTH